MSRQRYTEEFKIEAVKQVTERGHPVTEVAARLGVSGYSLYQGMKRYAKPAAQRQQDADLQAENRRLKAERILQHDADLAALLGDSPDDSLHELRKTVKRIRFLAELEPRRHRACLAGLKQRQTLLGEFQGLCTQ